VIRVSYRDPFAPFSVTGRSVTADQTVADAARAASVPAEWFDQPFAWVNGVPCDDPDKVLRDGDVLILQPRLMGGGGSGGRGGGKNPFATIAALGLTLLTGFVAGGGLATRFGLSAFAQGTIASRLAAAGVALGGARLLAGLQPAPGVQGQAQIDAGRSGAASADGNIAQANGPIPRVVGRRKVFPPFACEPFVYFDGEDEIVEAVCVLAGPHQITDIRLGNALLEEMPGVVSQVLEGWPGEPSIELVQRFAKTEQIGVELKGHTLEDDGLTADLSAEAGFLPQPYVSATTDAPDEYRFDIAFAQGLNDGGSSTRLRVPFRLRMRQPGDDWINLPEVHFRGVSLQQLRATIRLLWSDGPQEVVAAQGDGFCEVRREVPAQTVAPVSDGWQADAHFGTTGDTYLTANNLSASGVENVEATRHEVRFHLSGATFPRGRWEVEITRGAAINDGAFVSSTYAYSGVVLDLFGVRDVGTLRVPRRQSDLSATIALIRAASVYNRNPIAGDGMATIVVVARNRQLGPISAVAAGYVRDWQIAPENLGDEFPDPDAVPMAWTTTSNPGPHLLDVLTGRLNADPVPERIVDRADILAWRNRCAIEGYEVNAIVEDGTVDTVLELIAGAGFGRPRKSNAWGIVQGRDFTGTDPDVIFTPRNSAGLTMDKPLADRLDGILAVFRDADRNYAERQIVEPPEAVGGLLQQVTYDAEVTEAEVRRRARRELRQARLQTATYTLNAPAEAMIVRRGDLVGVEHDVFARATGRGRVIGWTETGGLVETLTLDDAVEIAREPEFPSVPDLLAVEDMLAIGATYAVAINGVAYPVTEASGTWTTLTLETPVAIAGLAAEPVATVGRTEAVYERMIVADVIPRPDFSARLTLIDETPEIWQ
jgi:hypothetical protein